MRFNYPQSRLGPVIWIIGLQYFVTQLLVARSWRPPASIPYSWANNQISDLGNTTCGRYGDRLVCSPDHLLMNLSFLLVGAGMSLGSAAIYQSFGTGVWRRASLIVLMFAGVGTIIVGLAPENTIAPLHLLGAGMALVLGNIGMILFGLTQSTLTHYWRGYSVLFGVIGLVGLWLYLAHVSLGIGHGGMERVAAYPQTLWLITFGWYLLYRRRNNSPSVATPS